MAVEQAKGTDLDKEASELAARLKEINEKRAAMKAEKFNSLPRAEQISIQSAKTVLKVQKAFKEAKFDEAEKLLSELVASAKEGKKLQAGQPA